MEAIPKKKLAKYSLTALRFILPIVILFIIFRQINFIEFKSNISETNIWLVIAGIAYCPVVILIGSIRWQTVVEECLGKKVSTPFMLRHYWIGLTLGFFAPASLGWDAYKIAAAGKRYGNYLKNIAAIIVEKIMALLSVSFLIVIFYPFVKKYIINDHEFIDHLIHVTSYILSISVVGILFLALLMRHQLTLWLDEKLHGFIKKIYIKIYNISGFSGKSTNIHISLSELFRPLTSPVSLMKIFMLSLAIQIVSAVGNQILFRAVGYPLPIMVNFFLLPIFFFIFIMPISFGSIGIREGAYILLYGLFGVPKETALLVSLLNLGGIILNQCIGALLMMTCYRAEENIASENIYNKN